MDVSQHLNTLERNYYLMRRGSKLFKRLTAIQVQFSYLQGLLEHAQLQMGGGLAGVGAAGA